MQILRRGNEIDPNWSLDVTCTSAGWNNKTNPCFSELRLNSKDVYKRKCIVNMGDLETFYGFICPVCGCFTEINPDKIPYAIKNGALQVAARSSRFYDSLTEEGKKISENL